VLQEYGWPAGYVSYCSTCSAGHTARFLRFSFCITPRCKSSRVDTGAVTLIQRFGSAANLNIHLHCLVLDGVYRTAAAL